MEVVCCLCKKHICYKEPMDDKRIRHGMCNRCAVEQDKILDELIEKRKRISHFLLGGGNKPQD